MRLGYFRFCTWLLVGGQEPWSQETGPEAHRSGTWSQAVLGPELWPLSLLLSPPHRLKTHPGSTSTRTCQGLGWPVVGDGRVQDPAWSKVHFYLWAPQHPMPGAAGPQEAPSDQAGPDPQELHLQRWAAKVSRETAEQAADSSVGAPGQPLSLSSGSLILSEHQPSQRVCESSQCPLGTPLQNRIGGDLDPMGLHGPISRNN